MSIVIPRPCRNVLLFTVVMAVFLVFLHVNLYPCDSCNDDDDDDRGIPVEAMPRGIAVNPNTHQAVVTNKKSNSISIIDLKTQKVLSVIRVGRAPMGVAIDRSLNIAVVSNSKDDDVTLVDLAHRRCLSSIRVGNAPAGVAVDQIRHLAAVTNLRDNTVMVINISSMQVITTVKTGKRPIDAAIYTEQGGYGGNESTALVVNRRDHNLSVVDLNRYVLAKTITVGKRPRAVDINPNTKLAVVSDVKDNAIDVINMQTWKTYDIHVGKHPVDVAVNPADNRAVVICEEENKLYLVDLTSGRTIRTYSINRQARGVAVDSVLNVAAVVDDHTDSVMVIQLPFATPAPSIAITSPANNASLTKAYVEVTGTATIGCKVTVNDIPADMSDGNFTVNIDLTQGSNTITATATDGYGRMAHFSITVNVSLKQTITGTVKNQLNGRLLSGASVSITDAAQATRTTTTNNNGQYEITDLAAGGFSSVTSKQWYVPYSYTGYISAGQTVVSNVILEPIAPIITELTATDITPDSARITWKTDQPSDSQVVYSTGYGGDTVTDATLTTSHSMVLTTLRPSQTYYYRVMSTGENGATGVSPYNQFYTKAQVNLQITSPANGAAINGSSVMVYGNVSSTAWNDEIGVTVNGIVASVVNGQFAVSHVPLTEGQNKITVVVTDTGGATATQTITVNAATTGDYIKVSATPESGVGPLETTLRISGTIAITSPSISINGSGYVEQLQSDDPETYKFRMTTPGLYYFTATVKDKNNISYSDTVMVAVMSLTEIDAMLREKWTALTGALQQKDTTTALNLIHPYSQARYQTIFNILKDQLPAIVATDTDLVLHSIIENRAYYELGTMENGVAFTYRVSFIKDAKGLWVIREF